MHFNIWLMTIKLSQVKLVLDDFGLALSLDSWIKHSICVYLIYINKFKTWMWCQHKFFLKSFFFHRKTIPLTGFNDLSIFILCIVRRVPFFFLETCKIFSFFSLYSFTRMCYQLHFWFWAAPRQRQICLKW